MQSLSRGLGGGREAGAERDRGRRPRQVIWGKAEGRDCPGVGSLLLPARQTGSQLEPTDWSPGLLTPRPPGSFPTRLTPPQPATPSAQRHPCPLPQPQQSHFPADQPSSTSPLPLLTQAACPEGLPPRHPHPNPSSLQSWCSLPSIDISWSKGLSTAWNCNTEPQPAFPASLLLPSLWEGAKKLSPPAPGLSQAVELQGGERQVLGLPGSL